MSDSPSLASIDLAIREHQPSGTWSRVVPLSSNGRPLLARDRRREADAPLDRLATPLVGTLAALAGVLAILLLL